MCHQKKKKKKTCMQSGKVKTSTLIIKFGYWLGARTETLNPVGVNSGCCFMPQVIDYQNCAEFFCTLTI